MVRRADRFVGRYGSPPAVSPRLIMELRDSSFAADLFIAAVGWLDFFSWLEEHPGTADEIARGLDLAARPLDVMLTLFRSYGLITERRDRFSNTARAGAYLVEHGDFSLGPYVSSLRDRPACRLMLDALRTGVPQSWAAAKGADDWARSMADGAFAAAFSQGMNARGAYLAHALARHLPLGRHRRLLDIGGSTGIYSIILCRRFRNLSATVFEKQPVDELSRRTIADLGMQDRVDAIGSDMFGARYPEGYDVHIYSHVLHDWDEAAVRRLINKSYDALPTGGLLAIHDVHINSGKSGPVRAAEYSVLLMFSTVGKCYSVDEIGEMVHEAGFSKVRTKNTAVNRSVILARK